MKILLRNSFIFTYLFRFVIEENQKKKKKRRKPRVIHALGNIKWGFTPPQKTGAVNVDQLQTRWDREHMMKEQVQLYKMYKIHTYIKR